MTSVKGDPVGKIVSLSALRAIVRRGSASQGEMTGATHSGGTSESYSYDSNGNRTNTGYSTGTNNQLSSDGTYNYVYDDAGNLTKKTTILTGAYVTYTWDYHNRLTDVEAYNSSNVLQSHVHYTYDVLDRLIGRCHPKLGRHLGVLGKVAFTWCSAIGLTSLTAGRILR